jgi:hypothetical protein
LVLGFCGIAFSALQQWVRGFARVVLSEYLNREIDSRTRATVISLQSMLSSLVYGMLLLPLGKVADLPGLGIRSALTFAGLGALAVGMFLLLKRPRFKKED